MKFKLLLLSGVLTIFFTLFYITFNFPYDKEVLEFFLNKEIVLISPVGFLGIILFLFFEYVLFLKTREKFQKKLYLYPFYFVVPTIIIAEFIFWAYTGFNFRGWDFVGVILILYIGVGVLLCFLLRTALQHFFHAFFQKYQQICFTFIYKKFIWIFSILSIFSGILFGIIVFDHTTHGEFIKISEKAYRRTVSTEIVQNNDITFCHKSRDRGILNTKSSSWCYRTYIQQKYQILPNTSISDISNNAQILSKKCVEFPICLQSIHQWKLESISSKIHAKLLDIMFSSKLTTQWRSDKMSIEHKYYRSDQKNRISFYFGFSQQKPIKISENIYKKLDEVFRLDYDDILTDNEIETDVINPWNKISFSVPFRRLEPNIEKFYKFFEKEILPIL